MIDSHCHINDDLYKNNPVLYVNDSKNAGVQNFLVVGFDLDSSIKAVEIAESIPECYAAIGFHPSDISKIKDDSFGILKGLAKSKKVIAIGEIGLDYYWDKDKNIQENQQIFFKKQIELANKLNLPVSIHCRDAIEDCLKILKQNPVINGGVMHCYSGSVESAKELIKLGFILGFGGTVTFKNSVKPKEVIASIPSNAYVLETDAPYLTPHPFRGQENHSKYLYLVRDMIANLRNCSVEQVEKESTENFKRIFKL